MWNQFSKMPASMLNHMRTIDGSEIGESNLLNTVGREEEIYIYIYEYTNY